MIAWACRLVMIWGGCALLIYAVVGQRALWIAQDSAKPAAEASPAPAEAQPQVAINTLVYHANRQGHVLLDAVVNGTPVRFMVDTGATLVALTLKDAAAAGIARYQLDYSGRASTASGEARFAPVRLREVRLGQLAIDDVPAAVIENLGTSLLGMSFLKRMQSYEMRDGTLTITW
jgi:clan AA aspartic protease (TIGR02281 family)